MITTNSKYQSMTIDELKDLASEKVNARNDMCADSKMSEAYEIDEELKVIIDTLTDKLRVQAVQKCLHAEDDPMLAAIKMLTFTTKVVRDVKDKELNHTLKSLEDAERWLDPLRVQSESVKANGKTATIGKSSVWHYAVEKLNLLMTCRETCRMGLNPITINDSFSMKEISKGVDLCKHDTSKKSPISEKSIKEAIQNVINMMIGEEYIVEDKHVHYIEDVYARATTGRALTVVCSNHARLRQYLCHMAHAIVERREFTLKYKLAK